MGFDLKNIASQGRAKGKALLPVLTGKAGLPTAYNRQPDRNKPPQRQLTRASIVYTLGAGVLFMMAIFNLMHGSWFNGIVIFIPAGSLLVLAYKYLQ